MRIITVATCLLFIAACHRQPLKDNCDNLKDAMVNDDIALAKSAVQNIISGLPSTDYTQANLQMLANRLTGDCHLSTEILCFDCIKTLPSQSEIRISANLSGTIKRRVLDISYTTSNRMTCVYMHE